MPSADLPGDRQTQHPVPRASTDRFALVRRWRSRLAGPLWSVLEYLWYPILLFVSTPLFLRVLGAADFGQWSLLSTTIGLGTILNVGTGAATVRQIADRLARGDSDGVALVVRAGLAIALVGGLTCGALILAVYGLGAATLFGRMGDTGTTIMTGAAAAVVLAIEQVENVFTSALRGGQRFRLIARIEIALRTLQIAAAAGAVYYFGTLSALYLALVITALLRLLVRAAIVMRLLALPSLRPDTGLIGLVVGDAGWGWLQGAGSLAFGLADRFIIGSMIGAAALAHYSVASQLAQPIHAFAAAGTSVIFPKISAAVARGDTDRLRQLLRTALILLVLAVTAASGTLLLLRGVILTAWLGPDVAAAAAPTLGWLCAAFWLLALVVLPHYVLLGLGRFRFIALANLAAGLVTVVVMLWAAGRYGIEGVAAARIVYGVILLTNFIPLFPLWKSHGSDSAQS